MNNFPKTIDSKKNITTTNNIQEMVNKIINEYNKYLKENLNTKNVRIAIGYQISCLKNYEIYDGIYPLRSITVIPNSSRVIDLLLIYNTNIGKLKLELHIKPINNDTYHIFKKDLTSYIEQDLYNTDTKLNIQIDNSKPYNSLSKIIEKEKMFLCPTKDVNCCYQNLNHDKDLCDYCCYNREHYHHE